MREAVAFAAVVVVTEVTSRFSSDRNQCYFCPSCVSDLKAVPFLRMASLVAAGVLQPVLQAGLVEADC